MTGPWPHLVPTLPLGRLAAVQLGKMLKPAPDAETDVEVRYLKAGSLSTMDSLDALPSMFASKQEITRYEVRTGDLVVAEGGDVGKAAFLPELPSGVIIQNSLHRIRTSLADLRYLKHCLDSVYGSGWLEVLCNKSTFGHLTKEKLTSLPIPLHSNLQQQAIAEYLDTETARIDALITKKRQMIQIVLERRMAVMSEGVRGGFTSRSTVPSKLHWVEERGEDWREVRLTLVSKMGTGHTPSRDHPEWWMNCTIPWITTGEVAQMRSDRLEVIEETRERISELGVANSSAEIHPAGTVVLCRTAASAGYSAIMATDMATSQDFATWTCGPLLRPRFLLLCLRVMRQDLLGRLAMGSTHKTIYMPDIEALRIPLPSCDEQDEIVDVVWSRLRAADKAIDAVNRQIDLLIEHRQALITAAVTGELDIPELAA
jgi:type I restriction enzyme S subunit